MERMMRQMDADMEAVMTKATFGATKEIGRAHV